MKYFVILEEIPFIFLKTHLSTKYWFLKFNKVPPETYSIVKSIRRKRKSSNLNKIIHCFYISKMYQ